MDKPKKIHRYGRIFIKSFTSYFLILSFLIIVFFGVFTYVVNKENIRRQTLQYQENASRITLLGDDFLNASNKIIDHLKNSRWVYKLTATDVFRDQFDYSRKKEIESELLYLAVHRCAVKHISVVYPSLDMTVSSVGWFGIEDYKLYLEKHYSIPRKDFLELVSNNDKRQNNIWLSDISDEYVIIFSDLVSSSSTRVAVIILVEKSKITQYLASVTQPNLKHISVSLNGASLCEFSGEADGVDFEINMPSILPNIEYNLTYATKSPEFFWVIFAGIMSIVVVVLLSFILAKHDYKPMHQLVEQISENYDNDTPLFKKQEEYDYIRDVLGFMKENNMNLQNKIDSYYQVARNSLLLQLLRGYFRKDNITEQLQQLGVNYDENGQYITFVITIENPSESVFNNEDQIILITCESILPDIKQLDVATLSKTTFVVIFNITHMLDNDFESQAEEMADSLTQNMGCKVSVSMGGSYHGLIGISKSFQDAKETDLMPACYLPLDWEIQLIHQLRQGDWDEVAGVLKELRIENKLRGSEPQREETLCIELLRILEKTAEPICANIAINVKSVLQSKFELEWEFVEKTAYLICNESIAQSNAQICDIKKEILNYVNSHYCESDISLKSLGEHYKTSPISVSRIFKEVGNQNFYDYLTNLRMDKAKKLLLTIGYDLNYITKAVGYESEYSFRRAFLRQTGMKPREFIERNSGSIDKIN